MLTGLYPHPPLSSKCVVLSLPGLGVVSLCVCVCGVHEYSTVMLCACIICMNVVLCVCAGVSAGACTGLRIYVLCVAMHGFQNVRFALVHVKSTNHKYNAKVRSYTSVPD